VSLIAAVEFKQPVSVGTDVVCWNERSKFDYVHIEKNGLFDWIEMHADVFANAEIQHMKSGPLKLNIENTTVESTADDAISKCEKRGGTVSVTIKGRNEQRITRVEQDLIVDAKLRRFHAMWCLREAYVKMTGDALVAPWLKELEILAVQAPEAAAETIREDSLEQGEVVKDFPIFFKGEKVIDVAMEVSAIGQNFMIGGAVRRPVGVDDFAVRLGRWEELRLGDILAFAELHA
jgi:4'-phosphopantetheinyl transferase